MRLVGVVAFAVFFVCARAALAQTEDETADFILKHVDAIWIQGGKGAYATNVRVNYVPSKEGCTLLWKTRGNTGTGPSNIMLDVTQVYTNTITRGVTILLMDGVGFHGDPLMVNANWPGKGGGYFTETKLASSNDRLFNAFKYFTEAWCKGIIKAF